MQIVSPAFHQQSQAGIRPHIWGLWISFTKEYDDETEFAIWDTSTWDGGDIWSPVEDNPIQQWDYYVYQNFTDRVVSLEWTREIQFPYSVQAAIADFVVNNYDNYFTPEFNSPVDGYVLPKRPMRIYTGYQGQSLVQQIVGITQNMPVIDTASKKASFHALDFLSEMFSMSLTNVVAMADVTTDEVLSEIFQQFGLASTQYNLAQGRNRIPFVFFDKGKNAGNAFRELMQSEGGKLWLDEQGIIRFEQRLLPIDDPVIIFNDSNVDSISASGDTEIINTVRIRTDIRRVQPFQPVYSSSGEDGTTTFVEPLVVPANSTVFFTADLADPLLTVSTPTVGLKTDDSWFTAFNGDAEVSSNISISLDNLNNNNYVMLFDNDNAFDVRIDAVQVWGEPAKIVDEIRYEAYDEDSVAKYGEKVLEIDNNLFGSESNCESFALTIIDGYKEFSSVIEMSVKGDPALQLGDIIEVDTNDVHGEYKINKIVNSMVDSLAPQTISATKYTPRQWAFWDLALWDNNDLWTP